LRLLAFLLFTALIFVPGGLAQSHDEVHVQPHAKPSDPPLTAKSSDPALKTHTKPLRVDVDLVLIPATITDPMNRLVTGLERDNFELFENGEKQEIRHFSSEDAPLSLGVIFDTSGSMSNKIEKSREAVVEFFRTANPQDEFFMIAFSERPELVSDFTSSVEEIQGKLVSITPRGRTAMLDAIYMGLSKMRHAHQQKKALLIISDGGDNHSRYTESEIKNLVKEADVQLYAIGIFDATPRTPEEHMGPTMLASITDVTGGRTFTIDNPNELADVATIIGVELRNQYVLGYRPKKPGHDGKWRKVKVKLNPPKGLPPLHVYAKTGYYAPTEEVPAPARVPGCAEYLAGSANPVLSLSGARTAIGAGFRPAAGSRRAAARGNAQSAGQHRAGARRQAAGTGAVARGQRRFRIQEAGGGSRPARHRA
jgi:Ca-activated chloride channel family protein